MSEVGRDQMGESLWSLVASVGTALVEVEELGRRARDDPRRTYRLRFADGSTLKGRRFPSVERATLLWRIHAGAAAQYLTRAVAQEGDGLLEEWVDGESLAQGQVGERLLQEAGRMLGVLHTCPVASIDDLTFEPLDGGAWARKTVDAVRLLRQRRLISGDRAEWLAAQAMSDQPSDVTMGIVHRDLCPANLIVNRHGRLISVDNGTMTVGAIDHDLCRVWYRWPMTPAERGAFNRGYREHRDAEVPERPSNFWAIAVIVNSARTRLALSERSAVDALRRLDDLAPACPAQDLLAAP